jgi:hypothetical protein
MLKIYKTKFEYEAVELLRSDKDFKGKALKFSEVELSPLIKDLADSASLFSESDLYFVKCDKESSLEDLNKELLEACKGSVHGFIFWGKSIEFKKIVEGLNEKVIEKKELAADFFPKGLVSAIQSLDKRKTWLELRKELESKPTEEVYGVCNWALKQMLTSLAMQTFDEKSGMKEFQYRQVQRACAGKDPEQVKKVYFNFVNTYNTSRNQSIDLATALEMWVLGW